MPLCTLFDDGGVGFDFHAIHLLHAHVQLSGVQRTCGGEEREEEEREGKKMGKESRKKKKAKKEERKKGSDMTSTRYISAASKEPSG